MNDDCGPRLSGISDLRANRGDRIPAKDGVVMDRGRLRVPTDDILGGQFGDVRPECAKQFSHLSPGGPFPGGSGAGVNEVLSPDRVLQEPRSQRVQNQIDVWGDRKAEEQTDGVLRGLY